MTNYKTIIHSFKEFLCFRILMSEEENCSATETSEATNIVDTINPHRHTLR